MSRTLFRYTLRSNWILVTIFFAIMFMYLAIIISMYDPESIEDMLALVEMLPEELAALMGFDMGVTDLISFLASYYYSFLIILFPLIYCIILGNRLVAKHVDHGSMTYMLCTPKSRRRIVATQALFMIMSVVVLLGLVAATGLILTGIMFPGELDVGMYMSLNLGAMMLFVALSSICFFFSCMFDDTRHSLAFGGGIPVLFFIISVLANMGMGYEWLRHLTLLTLYNPGSILHGEQSVLIVSLVFAGIAALLYGAGIHIFSRRDLPL